MGVDDDRERLVLDLDQLERVARRVAVLGDDERDLLALEPDLVGREHRLDVGGHRRHPGQPRASQILAGDHGFDHGVLQRRGGVDRQDLRVGERAAQDRPVQHARQRDVVEERALTADESSVLLARDRAVGSFLLKRHLIAHD